MYIILSYENGHNVGTPEFTPPAPTRLQWDLNVKCIEAIEQSYRVMIIINLVLSKCSMCIAFSRYHDYITIDFKFNR